MKNSSWSAVHLMFNAIMASRLVLNVTKPQLVFTALAWLDKHFTVLPSRMVWISGSAESSTMRFRSASTCFSTTWTLPA